MPKKKREVTPSDYGTDERHQHGVVEPELTGRGYSVRMRARDACEIDRLLHRDDITQDEWSVADAFTRQLHAARMMGMTVSKPERIEGGGISDRQANALLEVTDTINWLDMAVGEQIRRLVVATCLSETKVEAQQDLRLLRLGLGSLLQLSPDRRMRVSLLDALAP